MQQEISVMNESSSHGMQTLAIQQQQPFLNQQQQMQSLNLQNVNPVVIPTLNIHGSNKDEVNPPAGYTLPRYPRDFIPENAEDNEALGGSYQKFLYSMGDCCGCIKQWIPCCVCDNPYLQIEQSTVGVFERFGKYVKTMPPGLTYFNICTDVIRIVDCKVQLIDCPRQWVMTKDNILVSIDATVYYRVVVPRKSLYYVDSIHSAVSHLTLATIKSMTTVTGAHTLQELLEKRQAVTELIEKFVDAHVWEWGIDVENMLIKDIQLNPELQSTLSLVAKEQRSAQAKILNAQADVQSARLMSEAATFLDSKAAMQIRYLETITILGQQSSTKVVFMPDD